MGEPPVVDFFQFLCGFELGYGISPIFSVWMNFQFLCGFEYGSRVYWEVEVENDLSIPLRIRGGC